MDTYGGRTQGPEGTQSDPVGEWSSPGGETGLEEPMWQLSLGASSESYPERPDEPDCIYFLKTGFCGYGARCRFNHHPDRISVVGALMATGGEYPERVGQPVCQYYMRTGMCKFGSSCKYHHPRQGGGSTIPATLNISGYPLRPGEKECSYYLKTGQCKFGLTCKFHHPQPENIQIAAPAAAAAVGTTVHAHTIYPEVQSPPVHFSQQYGVVANNWPVARPAMLPGSYIPGAYTPVLLPHGILPFPGWNPYQGALSPVASPNAQPAVGASPLYGITQLSSSAPAFTGPYLSAPSSTGPSGSTQREHMFPERPGQPECHYYMKTGDCKFGSSCRYHHPPEWTAEKHSFNLSLMGLPLRPGAPLCSHYAQNGVCKFGPSCKFDHPLGTLSYSPSASSLSDMPVAPYPVGSTIGTLAPSSSSSDLRHSDLTVSNKDTFSTRMSSSMSTSSGSIFSRSGPISQSSGTTTTKQHQHGQNSVPSTGSGSSSGHGGEVPLN